MRAAVLHSPGDIRLEDVPEPQLTDGHAVVRVASVGVCGSDLPRMLVKGAHRMPLICGHEFSGHIATLGAGVEGFSAGDLVAVPPMLPCHTCDQCLKGQFSRCRDYDYFGSRRDGAYAEYVLVPAANLLKAPEGADPRALAMADPASIALHALWKAGGITFGQRGGVIGCGPIGLFAIQWMRLAGATEVVAVDISERKLKLAAEAGATHCLLAGDEAVRALPCDVVVEAAGTPAAIDAAVQLAAPGGHASFIGIPRAEVVLPNAAFQHFLRQEVSLHGSWNSFGAPFPGPQWSATLEALGTGRLKWEFLISHDLDLEQLPAMFARFRDEKDMFFSKVLFHP